MTRKEWIEKNLPAYVSNKAHGGVLYCPSWYHELVRIDPGVLNKLCENRPDLTEFKVCEECWNTELNIKEERSNNHDS